MKLLEALGSVAIAVALWIVIAFFVGLVSRPIYEAWKVGFSLWG